MIEPSSEQLVVAHNLCKKSPCDFYLKLIYGNNFKIMVFHLRLKFLETMVINI